MKGISNLRKRFRREDSRKRESPSIWHWIWHWRGFVSRFSTSTNPTREVATEPPSQRGALAASTASDSARPRGHRPSVWCDSLQEVAPPRKRLHLPAHEQKPQHVFVG